jgi:hypothetical protein
MSRASAKASGRSAKTASGARKKSSKSARKTVKKASASTSRRSAPKTTRPQRTAPAAAKPPSRKPAAVAAKMVETAISASVKTIVTPSIKAIAAEATMIRTISPPVQPAAPDVPVYPHKYRVGEVVYYTSPSFGRAAATGSYTVIKLLPSDGDDYQYRIKSSGEAFERVAKESQLDRA